MEPAALTNQREEPPITGKAFELMRAAFIDANPNPRRRGNALGDEISPGSADAMMRAATFTPMPLKSPPRHAVAPAGSAESRHDARIVWRIRLPVSTRPQV
jgi:hypothetical protein